MLALVMATSISATETESGAATNTELHKGHEQKEKMDTHMKMMKIQMQAIREEADPEKRKVLMQAHRQSMREGMKMMRGNGGQGMMSMMHGDRNKGMKNKMKGKEHSHGKMDQHVRMEHMEHRMNTMQMMMEQMMQHEDLMHKYSSN